METKKTRKDGSTIEYGTFEVVHIDPEGSGLDYKGHLGKQFKGARCCKNCTVIFGDDGNFGEMNNTILVLQSEDDRCLGVYTSEASLAVGVDVWMKKHPNKILTHEEWIDEELFSWDWCYIPRNARRKTLEAGGAPYIPKREFWGKNLIALIENGIDIIFY